MRRTLRLSFALFGGSAKQIAVKWSQSTQFLFIFVAAAFVYAFVSTAKEGETRRACDALCAMKPQYADTTRRAPNFTLPNLNGQPVSLSDFRGKVVILNFWSKSCPPCLAEMPTLAQLGESLKKRDDIVLLTITTDESAADAATTLLSTLGRPAPFEVLVDPEAQVVTGLFGTKLYPETWYIDPEGVIRVRLDGQRDFGNAQALALAESLKRPMTCGIRFREGRAKGAHAALCRSMGH